jgi:hypothetical protein
VSWRPEGDALGTWLTTITFPDGTVRYCDYSTAVEAMVGPPPAPGVGGRIDPPPAPDLFAEWNAPDLCRTCFMTWLTKPPPVGPPEDPPVPAPKSSWWTALQRLWQG